MKRSLEGTDAMSDYDLTPSEIDALTHGIRDDDSFAAAPVPPGVTKLAAPPSRPAVAHFADQQNGRDSELSGWDAELQNVVRSVMDSFAAGSATELEGPTRTHVSIEVASIRQMSYGEFVLRLDNPTCTQLLDVLPFDAQFVLELHPSILFPVIDRLLGGGQLPAPIVRRPLTEIEGRLTARITRLLAAELISAWRPILDVDVRSTKLLCNPRMLRSENPNESMVVIRLQMALGDCQGPLQLAVRRSSLVALRESLLAPPSSRAALTSQLAVAVAQLQVTPDRLASLKVGDVLMSATEVGHPAIVSLDGQPQFTAKLGSFEGKKAIEIGESV